MFLLLGVWKLEFIFYKKIFKLLSLIFVTLNDIDSSSKYYGLWFSHSPLVLFTRTSKDSEKLHLCQIVASVVCIFFFSHYSFLNYGKEGVEGSSKKKISCVLKCVIREILGLANLCLIYIKHLNHRHAIQIEKIFKTVVNKGMTGIIAP